MLMRSAVLKGARKIEVEKKKIWLVEKDIF